MYVCIYHFFLYIRIYPVYLYDFWVKTKQNKKQDHIKDHIEAPKN